MGKKKDGFILSSVYKNICTGCLWACTIVLTFRLLAEDSNHFLYNPQQRDSVEMRLRAILVAYDKILGPKRNVGGAAFLFACSFVWFWLCTSRGERLWHFLARHPNTQSQAQRRRAVQYVDIKMMTGTPQSADNVGEVLQLMECGGGNAAWFISVVKQCGKRKQPDKTDRVCSL